MGALGSSLFFAVFWEIISELHPILDGNPGLPRDRGPK
jgi:hypothetical protein